MGEYKKSSGVSIITDKTPIPVKDWLDEGKALFGADVMKWKFRCPMCGHVASVQEFKDVGAESPDAAYQECIGRYRGAGSPNSKDGNPNGCNWAAYGLFGIPNGKGRLVLAEGGTVVEVFDYAKEVDPNIVPDSGTDTESEE